MSYAVDDPKIKEVLDMATGEIIGTHWAVGNEYDYAIQLRTKLREGIIDGSPLYTCPDCGVPVYLNCMAHERRFYFRHSYEDGSCPIETRNALSQDEMNAIRYNGAKESRLHLAMKDWICRSLREDQDFSDIFPEQIVKNKLTGKWRKPDVQAKYRGLPIAFEVQLSSTYSNVIAERRQFYLEEGGLLFWVFSKFDEGMRKLTQDDVFYNNNQNAFLVAPETVEASAQNREFMMQCIWREPTSAVEVSDLRQQLVRFSELTIDQPCQQAYFYDFYGEREKIRESEAESLRLLEVMRAEDIERRRQKYLNELRARFIFAWETWVLYRRCHVDEWQELRNEFDSSVSRILPEHPSLIPDPIFKALYSLKVGEPFGWNYKKLVQVAHMMLPGNDRDDIDPYLDFFWKGIEAYGRTEQIKQEDLETGKWKRKIELHRDAVGRGAKPQSVDPLCNELINFVFPELAAIDATKKKQKAPR